MTGQLDGLVSFLSDRYAIEREIGAGGMATVYLAQDVKHDRRVALKVLRPEIAAAMGGERFLREIRVAAKLNHPHILPLLDSGEAGGALFYTMPPVEGESLRARIDRDGQLALHDAVSVATDVAAALDYAHAQGVVHRDIKPENILIHHGEPMVADFGIALAVTESGGERLTGTGLSIGTPAYMSPEQVSGDRVLDGRSDIYALGCVLYEMVTGEPPFTGRTAQAVMARQVTDAVPPIATVRPDVPAHVVDVAMRALAKAPADRFGTAGELARTLADGPGPASATRERESQSVPSALPAERRASIAVLPLSNLSPDPENEYFGDGVTDDIITHLSGIGAFKVISRTSSMRYKQTDKSMQAIAADLSVTNLVEGSVRRAGNRLRVAVQLVDAVRDEQLWAETFDRDLTDVFAIQSEVALNVAAALQATLSPDEREQLRRPPTDDLAAYDLYLLGRHHLSKRTDESIRQAIGHFESALALDSRFVRAHAGLAEAYLFAGMGYAAMPPKEALPKAKEAAARAIALNPASAEAHGTHGFATLLCDWDANAALIELRQAASLNPDRPEPHQWLAWCLVMHGEIAAGLESLERALDIDPLSAVVITENGWPFSYVGLDELALERYRRAIEIDPTFALAHYNAGWALHRLGRLDAAIPAYERGVELSGGAPFMQAFLAAALVEAGRTEEARRILDDLLARSTHAYGIGMSIAMAAKSLGEHELALDWLDRAFEERDPFLATLGLDEAWWDFASLHDHPRFRALLDRIGIRQLLASEYQPRERAKILARMQSTQESGAPELEPEPVQPPRDAPASSEKPMIVVLPLTNMSASGDDEYFSDGMTQDIIAHLSQIGSLQVISRTSTMRYKNSTQTVREIAAALKATHVVEGSVRRAGDRLRIVATLIDARSENHLWSDTYDRRLTDVFEIQTDVATNIAAALRTTLSRADRARLEKAPTANMDAYGLWLRGRSAWADMNAETLLRSLELFRRATELDPEFPHPYVGIADACIWQGIGLGVGTPEENRNAAKAAALRALDLDETLAEAHSSLAHVECWFDWDWDAAERSFERALELNPSYALARQGYATLLTCTGRHPEAMAQVDRAEELDPLSLEVKRTRGWLQWHARDHHQAFETLREVLALDPAFAPALLTIPWVAVEAGKIDEAIDLARNAVDATNRSSIALAELAYAYARGGRQQESRRVLDEIWALPESSRYNVSCHVVPVYAALGDRDRALQHLELAFRNREAMLMYLKVGAHFDGLRAEPRFRELARELGLQADTPAPGEPSTVTRSTSTERHALDGTHDRHGAIGVAVLPFENVGANVADEFFSDGVTEDIITQLSKIRTLKVISRASSMRYKNSADPLQEIASVLGVARLVQGSIRYAGNRVRITARLIDAGTDRELWAESYDRDLSDVFAIQHDVAHRVAGALRAELTPAERQRLDRRPTADVDAYREYLLGRHHWSRWTEDDFKQSIEHFERAIQRDPLFAEAHSALSEAWSSLGVGYWSVRPLHAYPRARDAALRAVELDPESAEAHGRLAMVEWWFEFAFDRALQRLERATALNPNCASAFDYRANVLTMLGRHDEALTFGRRACELDPASIFINANLALYLYRARRWSDAIAQFQRVIDLDPNLPMGHGLQALAYLESGDMARAMEAFERADRLSSGHHAYHVMLGYGHAAAGDHDEAHEIFREIEAQRAKENVWLVMLAMGYARLGEKDRALDLLEDAHRERGGWIVWLAVEPGLDALREEPRFTVLLNRMGLPSIHRDTSDVEQRTGASIEPSMSHRRAEAVTSSDVAGDTTVERSTRLSLLVLPFANASPDPENDHVGDGLTDELITDLAKVRSLRVIARSSSMKLKGTTKDLETLGRDLGVQYVLEGSVRRAGDDLRITAQLVDVTDQSPVWAERYSGTVERIFDLQEDVSRAIVQALDLKLTGAEHAAIAARPIPSLLAYEYYLKARRDILHFDTASIERALTYLREGLDILGDNVPLLQGLGLAQMQMLNAGASEDESLIDEVERTAGRIRQLDPEAAGGFLLAGCAGWLRGDFRHAVLDLLEAYWRDPTDPETMLFLGVSMLSTGQPDRSRAIIDELVRVDPLAPLSHLLVAYVAFFQGRFDDSVDPMRRSLELGPDVPVSLWCAVRIFAAASLPDEALDAARVLEDKHPGTPFTESAGIFAAALRARPDTVGAPSTALRAWATRDAEWGQYLVDAYARAGRERDALEWLEICVRGGFLNEEYLARHDPFVASLRESEQFGKLLERIAREHNAFEARLDPKKFAV